MRYRPDVRRCSAAACWGDHHCHRQSASGCGVGTGLSGRDDHCARPEELPAHELDQILKQVPGVQLFRRSDSTSGHPTSQGVTLRALGGNASSRALLILDGVPQADPFGGWVNWPAYDAAGLQEFASFAVAVWCLTARARWPA